MPPPGPMWMPGRSRGVSADRPTSPPEWWCRCSGRTFPESHRAPALPQPCCGPATFRAECPLKSLDREPHVACWVTRGWCCRHAAPKRGMFDGHAQAFTHRGPAAPPRIRGRAARAAAAAPRLRRGLRQWRPVRRQRKPRSSTTSRPTGSTTKASISSTRSTTPRKRPRNSRRSTASLRIRIGRARRC